MDVKSRWWVFTQHAPCVKQARSRHDSSDEDAQLPLVNVRPARQEFPWADGSSHGNSCQHHPLGGPPFGSLHGQAQPRSPRRPREKLLSTCARMCMSVSPCLTGEWAPPLASSLWQFQLQHWRRMDADEINPREVACGSGRLSKCFMAGSLSPLLTVLQRTLALSRSFRKCSVVGPGQNGSPPATRLGELSAEKQQPSLDPVCRAPGGGQL